MENRCDEGGRDRDHGRGQGDSRRNGHRTTYKPVHGYFFKCRSPALTRYLESMLHLLLQRSYNQGRTAITADIFWV